MITLGKPLRAEDLADGRRRRLLEPHTIVVTVKGKALTITVPVGFISDGASVPWGLWNLARPWNEFGPAAVVHDYLYERGPSYLPRVTADWIFGEHMKAICPTLPGNWLKRAWRAVRRRAMYRAVQIGGWWSWNEHRAREKE